MARWLRTLLYGHRYHDIDIVNCYPVSFLNIFARAGVGPTPCLQRLVYERETVLRELTHGFPDLQRHEAKNAFLAAMHGGGCRNLPPCLQRRPPRCFTLFVDEFRGNVERLRQATDWRDLFSRAQERATGRARGNAAGTFAAWAAQCVERYALHHLEEFLVVHGWRVDVLIHDGLLVRRRGAGPFPAHLLEDFSRWFALERRLPHPFMVMEKPMDAIPAVLDVLSSAAL
ncbi:MAG: hypothetical protein GY714_18375, partial [Desulfobacterales bacterium]|nr:hypothetical protein [Desulfobacterales bacterium]